MATLMRRRAALRAGGLGAASALTLAAMGCGGQGGDQASPVSSSPIAGGGGAAQATQSTGAATQTAAQPKRGGTFLQGLRSYRTLDTHQETVGGTLYAVGPCFDNVLQ